VVCIEQDVLSFLIGAILALFLHLRTLLKSRGLRCLVKW